MALSTIILTSSCLNFVLIGLNALGAPGQLGGGGGIDCKSSVIMVKKCGRLVICFLFCEVTAGKFVLVVFIEEMDPTHCFFALHISILAVELLNTI